MKTIIAGSRTVTEYMTVLEAILNSDFTVTEVVSGTARGVDQLGELFASDMQLPVKKFPADWNGLGKRAGYVRNTQMADYAEQLIAIWDGKSPGTKHMIDIATKKGLAVYVQQTNRN
jgi:hypothetical protein